METDISQRCPATVNDADTDQVIRPTRDTDHIGEGLGHVSHTNTARLNQQLPNAPGDCSSVDAEGSRVNAETDAGDKQDGDASVIPDTGRSDMCKEDEDVILTLSPARNEDEEDMDVQGNDDEELTETMENKLLAEDLSNTDEGAKSDVTDKFLETKDNTLPKTSQGDGGDPKKTQEVTGEGQEEIVEKIIHDEGVKGDKDASKLRNLLLNTSPSTEVEMEHITDGNDQHLDDGSSKSQSVKDDNDNDKDTVSTATAEECGEGSVGTNNAEDENEDHDNDSSFLTVENINKIAEHTQSNTESDSEAEAETTKDSKRERKTKDFGASFVTEDEDMGLMIDPDWKEKKKSPFAFRGRPSSEQKLDLDILRVPFDYGWKREIVMRNQKEGMTTAMDTYYHPPEGSKLRSMVQIADYLAKHKSPLSTDNFSFARKCIFEPPFEILRKANSGSAFFQKKLRGRGRSRSRARGRGWSPCRGRGPKVISPSTTPQEPVSSPASASKSTPHKRRPGRPSRLSFPPPEVVIERDDDEPDSGPSLQVKFDSNVSIKRSHSDVEEDDTDDDNASVTSDPPKKKATARKSTTPRIAKPVSKLMPPKPLGQLCTLQCPGLEGNPPSLQCAGCMCLFHPKCVNYQGSNMTSFLCLICAQDPNKKFSIPVNTVVSATPSLISSPTSSTAAPLITVSRSLLTPNTSTIIVRPNLPVVQQPVRQINGRTITTVDQNSDAIGALRSILDKRQPNVPNFSSLNIVTSIAPGIQAPTIQNLLATTGMRTVNVSVGSTTSVPILPIATTSIRPPTIIPSPSSGPIPTSLVRAAPPLTLLRPPPPSHNKQSQPSIPAIPPPKLTVAPGVLVPASDSGMIHPRTDGHMASCSPKPADIPLNAQLLTLPEAVTKRLKLSQPLALKINNIQIVVPPSCVINSSEGLKVLLPPSTFPIPSDPNAKLSVTVSNNTSGLEGGESKDSGPVSATTPGEGESRSVCNKDSPVITSPSTRASKRRQAIDAASCYIKKLYGGYDCMLQIFEYLRTQDLLRASTVCRTWKKIATQPCLWKRVRLRSTVISDWEAAALFFRKVRVESLCLQGMYHKHDRNRTWHLMIANLHHLVGLREIEFGHVPSTVLHQVCENLVNLEVFKAEYIAEINGDQNRNIPCKVDLGKFVCLKHLRELRLRGTGGLTLPAFSFNGGLAELAALKNLEILSLTSLKSIPDNEFHFLRDMKQLKFLEVGNCNTWSSETYFVLGSLTSLVHLRLEYGGEIPDIGLGDALSNLNNLEELQLIHFSLSDTLYLILRQLKKLTTLVVWPEAADMAAVNTNTLTIVSKLQKLQVLEWGVIVPSDASAPESDNDRQAMWIPFYPPSYMQMEKESSCPSVSINRLSLIQLTESLADCLPNTDIKVKKIKSQVKVNGWTNDS